MKPLEELLEISLRTKKPVTPLILEYYRLIEKYESHKIVIHELNRYYTRGEYETFRIILRD